VGSGPVVSGPVAGPSTAPVLRAARDAILAALAPTGADGYAAAKAALAKLPADELVEVAALLAVMLGRPSEMLLLAEEWDELADRWGDLP
jgi:hypothetical protein